MTHEKLDLMQHRDLVARVRITHPAYELASTEIARAFNSVGDTDFPLCLQILGPSRAGKTCVVKDFISSVPPSRGSEGLLIPVVYARIPPKGTTMALLENILRAVGDPYWYRGSESNKLARVLLQLEKCECKMLVLDEFQHLCDKGQNVTLKRTTDNLKALVEPNKWALVASGLSESRRVIDSDPQLEGRFDAEVEIPRFDWLDSTLNSQFRGVIASFEASLSPFDFPSFSDDSIALRIYLATGGLMGLIVKLLHRAIEDAIRDDRLAINLKHLEQAFRRSIRTAARIDPGDGPFECKLTEALIARRMNDLVLRVNSEPDDEAEPDQEAPPSKDAKARKKTKADHKRELADAL